MMPIGREMSAIFRVDLKSNKVERMAKMSVVWSEGSEESRAWALRVVPM